MENSLSNIALVTIKEIYETNRHSVANDYIKEGWILINTYTSCNERPNDLTMFYVLGWPFNEPAKLPQKHDESHLWNNPNASFED